MYYMSKKSPILQYVNVNFYSKCCFFKLDRLLWYYKKIKNINQLNCISTGYIRGVWEILGKKLLFRNKERKARKQISPPPLINFFVLLFLILYSFIALLLILLIAGKPYPIRLFRLIDKRKDDFPGKTFCCPRHSNPTLRSGK